MVKVYQGSYGEEAFLWCLQKEDALVSLLNQARGVGGPGQVLQDIEAGDTFNSCFVDMDRAMRSYMHPPEVHNEVFDFSGVKEQIFVMSPSKHMLYYLSRLFHHCC